MSPPPASFRRGSALVAFAIFAIIVLGVAALAIDLGQANLTRRQLQAGADAAALEGLRWRDTVTDPERRLMASQAVARLFDADLDLDTEDNLLGAGPQIDVTGVGPLDALGQLTVGNPAEGSARPLYRERSPVDGSNTGWLALNLPNLAQGDLVAGTYDPAAPHTDGQDPGGTWLPYQRPDMTPALAADSGSADAFLARMRRTSDPFGLDRQAGISTAGPPLPWLFARGSTLRAGNGASLADGITVRATSIASLDRARTIGPQVLGSSITLPDTTTLNGIVGFAPFTLTLASMGPQPVGHTITIRVTPSGQIRDITSGPGTVIGRAIRSTHLTSDMDPSDSFLPAANVADTLGRLPARVRVGDEVMLVTGTSFNLGYSVLRGQEGTTPGAHPTGTRVTLAEPVSIGMAVDAIATLFLAPQPGLTLINTDLDLPQRPGEPGDDLRAEFIVPLAAAMPSLPGVGLIVGFIRVEAVGDLVQPDRFTLTKLPGSVPPLNASASITVDFLATIEQVAGPLTPQQRAGVTREVLDRATGPELVAPVPAAALVRSY